jgi:hypothetical protein
MRQKYVLYYMDYSFVGIVDTGKVIFFFDSMQLTNLICDGDSAHHRFANEIHSIRNLLANEWDVVINHILCEGNTCADVMAKWKLFLPLDW